MTSGGQRVAPCSHRESVLVVVCSREASSCWVIRRRACLIRETGSALSNAALPLGISQDILSDS